MSQPLKSGMPENNGCEEWSPSQKKIFRGGGIGAAVNGGIGLMFSLTPLFTQLTGSSGLNQTIAMTLLGVFTGATLGALIALPFCDEEETLSEELSSRGNAEGKRADTKKLAEANRQ